MKIVQIVKMGNMFASLILLQVKACLTHFLLFYCPEQPVELCREAEAVFRRTYE